MWQVSNYSVIYEIPAEKPTYVWEYDGEPFLTITTHSDEADKSFTRVLSDMEDMYFEKGEKHEKSQNHKGI